MTWYTTEHAKRDALIQSKTKRWIPIDLVVEPGVYETKRNEYSEIVTRWWDGYSWRLNHCQHVPFPSKKDSSPVFCPESRTGP